MTPILEENLHWIKKVSCRGFWVKFQGEIVMICAMGYILCERRSLRLLDAGKHAIFYLNISSHSKKKSKFFFLIHFSCLKFKSYLTIYTPTDSPRSPLSNHIPHVQFTQKIHKLTAEKLRTQTHLPASCYTEPTAILFQVERPSVRAEPSRGLQRPVVGTLATR
jgi:hypothetical protein